MPNPNPTQDVSRRIRNLAACYPNRGKRPEEELHAQLAQYQTYLGKYPAPVLDRVLGTNNPADGPPGIAHAKFPQWMPSPADITTICMAEFKTWQTNKQTYGRRALLAASDRMPSHPKDQMAWVEDAANDLERAGRLWQMEDRHANGGKDRVTPQAVGMKRAAVLSKLFAAACVGKPMGGGK